MATVRLRLCRGPQPCRAVWYTVCCQLPANCAEGGLWYHVGSMQPRRLTIRRWVGAMSLGEVWHQIVAAVSAGTLPDLGAWSYVILMLLVFVEGPAATLVA